MDKNPVINEEMIVGMVLNRCGKRKVKKDAIQGIKINPPR
jgi:uncharacterized protein YneF (UPF0154 family)